MKLPNVLSSQNNPNISISLKRDATWIYLNDSEDRVKQMRKLFQPFDQVYYLFQPHEDFMRRYKVTHQRP